MVVLSEKLRLPALQSKRSFGLWLKMASLPKSRGKKLILFYNMYFAQPERGVFHCTAGRGALSLVTDIPRTTERGTPFDLELLNTILDRLNKLDGKEHRVTDTSICDPA